MIFGGVVWRFGDNIDTDQILPAKYINMTDRKERASHCFEIVKPGFTSSVKPGDILVAGENFACGSSRPSVEILQDLGVQAVVARSFARIFFRGAIARGFPLVVCPLLRGGDLPEGNMVRVDLDRGIVLDEEKGMAFNCEKYPPFFKEIIAAGGLMNYARRQLGKY